MNRSIKDNVVDNMLATAPAPLTLLQSLSNILGITMSLFALVVGLCVYSVVLDLGWKALVWVFTY